MYLLNTTTLRLEHFVANVPYYVILSHTWGYGEVTFDDIHEDHAKAMAGYKKVRRCCQRAVADGFKYAWIDTCCIDKRSSAELSEAINSMYRYYSRAEICYAYLSDLKLTEGGDQERESTKFEDSRWFTRGWTLQELLAPELVEFYVSDAEGNWTMIGTKRTLLDRIEKATNIHRSFLQHSANVRYASIAQKFSWASRRETTREEDEAYCLMGLLDVNMPLLYGEGRKAFVRLQLEFIKHSNDQTILCWKDQRSSNGPFCDSPWPFRNCGNIRPIENNNMSSAENHVMTNLGFRIRLPCYAHKPGTSRVLAILEAGESKFNKVCQLGLWLVEKPTGSGFYERELHERRGLTIVTEDMILKPKEHRTLLLRGNSDPASQISNATGLKVLLSVRSTDSQMKVLRATQLSQGTPWEGGLDALGSRGVSEDTGLVISNGQTAFILMYGICCEQMWCRHCPVLANRATKPIVEDMIELWKATPRAALSDYSVHGTSWWWLDDEHRVVVHVRARKQRKMGFVFWCLDVAIGQASGDAKFVDVQGEDVAPTSRLALAFDERVRLF